MRLPATVRANPWSVAIVVLQLAIIAFLIFLLGETRGWGSLLDDTLDDRLGAVSLAIEETCVRR